MSDNKHTGRSFSGKGYYIALILCAAAIGITGYLYARHDETVREVSVTLPVAPPTEKPILATEAPSVPVTPRPTIPAPTEKPRALETASPLAGEEIGGYAVEALGYNETTRDWRTHHGIDLSAQEGAEVCAAADGEVYTTYQDDALGHTVVIRHTGGYTTKYCSLTEDIPVKAGDSVKLGQVIGHAGTTALIENALGPHVHFSVTHQDKPMDPADFLSLGK